MPPKPPIIHQTPEHLGCRQVLGPGKSAGGLRIAPKCCQTRPMIKAKRRNNTTEPEQQYKTQDETMQRANSTSSALKLFGMLILALTLAACGSSDSDSSRRNNIIDGAMPSPGSGADTGGDTKPDDENEGDSGGEIDGGPSQLGSGIDDDFTPGTIAVGIGTATLSPGGRTTLSVTLVNHQNVVVVSPVEVAFSSRCLSAGSAYLTGTASENSNVAITTHGQATVTYHANGCVGEDRITARATYEGVLAGSAWGSVVVGSDTVQNLVFVGAEPELIQIRQAGGLETSRLTFQVLGATGSPMRDVPVNFRLNHTLGN